MPKVHDRDSYNHNYREANTSVEVLFYCKSWQSIYRAQVEGVPPTIVQRYLRNTAQAADAL